MVDPYDFYITPEEYEIAKQHGISKERVNQRIRDWGWNKGKAIITAPIYQADRKTWQKIALANGICKRTFFNRVNKLKWDAERAATTPILKPPGRKPKYGQDIQDKLKTNGISRSDFYYRIKHGWNIEMACTQKPLNPKEIIDNLIKYNKENGNYFCTLNMAYWDEKIKRKTKDFLDIFETS